MLHVENGKVTIGVPAHMALEVIQILADRTNIDENGLINLEFELDHVEEVKEKDSGEKIKELSWFIEEEEEKEEEGSDENVYDLFEGYIEDEEESEDFGEFIDTEDEDGDARSIHDISEATKDFIVKQYIQGVPTGVIKSENNVTKSALYSSLERNGIPRKGKLNRIIRRLEDGDSATEVAEEEEENLSVVARIIKDLKE